VLDFLDTLGLAEEMLDTLPHAVVSTFDWHTPGRHYTLADYRWASRRHPYYALIPQAWFLPFLAEKAAAYPGFDLRMRSRACRLLHDSHGRVQGVAYARGNGERQLRARLVVGADGRNSKMRVLGGFRSRELGAGLDVLWHAVPKQPDDPLLSGLQLHSTAGALLAVLDQDTHWQLGYLIPARSYQQVRAGGTAPITRAFAERMPWLGDRLDTLTDINQMTLLPVRITSVDHWYRPGLLLLGDAAHVISPVGGNGINLAIADAALAANLLLPNLTGSPESVDAACARIERVRRPLTDKEQHRQQRAERSACDRLRHGRVGPPMVLRALTRIPGLAAIAGRQNSALIRIPRPSEQILG
ncbi:MAG TPA: FAD-dependent monooxygenase, partial [Arthrobacter sp.]